LYFTQLLFYICSTNLLIIKIMAGVNKVILVGNLGKDPEVRHLEGGTTVASFTLATTESYKDKAGQRIDQTEWHNVVVWRGLAEVAEKYLKKGSSIYLEGKLRTRSYDKDGQKRYATEIVADTFTMLGKKESGNGQADTAEHAMISDEPPF
jgi:single-strand DNA-binding protein